MAVGDETILGPYATTTAGVTAAGAACDAAYVSANDKYIPIQGANGLQFWIIHIESA